MFIVNEPMGIVPYCYCNEFPIDSYNYDPYRFFIVKIAKPLARMALEIFSDSSVRAFLGNIATDMFLPILASVTLIFPTSYSYLGSGKSEENIKRCEPVTSPQSCLSHQQSSIDR